MSFYEHVTGALPRNGTTEVSMFSDFRTRLFDVLRGQGDWIASHDGRAIINDTLRDYENGASEKDLQMKHDIAVRENDYNRLVVYAGTGLGLVKERQSLLEILEDLEAQLADKVKALNEKLRFL